jgi:hypothetical protein
VGFRLHTVERAASAKPRVEIGAPAELAGTGRRDALALRRHHADTLIVRMSLIRDAYRAEILGGLADAGEQVLHVFLEVDPGVLRERLNARVTDPKYSEWDPWCCPTPLDVRHGGST